MVDGPRLATIMDRHAPDWVQLWMRRQGLMSITEPVRVAADPLLDLRARVVVPVRWQGGLLGWLWLLDVEGCLDDAALALAGHAGLVAGRLLASGRQGGPRLRLARDEVVERLLCEDPAVRRQAVQDGVSQGVLPDGPLRVLVADPGGIASPSDPDLLAVWRRSVAGLPALWAHAVAHEGRLVAVIGVTAEGSQDPQTLGRRARRALSAAGHNLAIGMGTAQSGVADLLTARVQAGHACTVARRVAEVDGVACWEQLGAYRALLSLPQPIDPALLDPRVAAAAGGLDPMLLTTIEVYLDEGASPGRTARRLHVHRGTVYYRLKRFAELTGCDLDGPERLTVHLAVKARRLTGAA